MKSIGSVRQIALVLALGLGSAPAATLPARAADAPAARKPAAPVVSAAKARRTDIVDTAQVTGTLVAREEILVGPEIEGLRILELLVDEGDKVEKGQTLARLSSDTLMAQRAQIEAQIGRSDASIEQARANIALAEAAIAQSDPALTRARALVKSGAGTEAVLEQRSSEHNSNLARLNAARRGLGVSVADKLNLEAQRDELNLKLGRTDVKAPAAGLVSRRSARVGGVASMAAEPMFRIIKGGEVELEAEAPDFKLPGMRAGQPAAIFPGGDRRLSGVVRLVSPEIDKVTRMGKARIAAGSDPALKIGAFARGEIEIERRTGVAIPTSAVLYDSEGAYAQTVKDGAVRTRRVSVGLVANGLAEIKSGLAEGEVVILRAGAFLNEGDAVDARLPEPAPAEQKASEKVGAR